MKVLLDECVTRHLKDDFIGPEVRTVEEAGFKGSTNGKLLQALSGQFDVLVTVDQNSISTDPKNLCSLHHRPQGQKKYVSYIEATDAAGA